MKTVQGWYKLMIPFPEPLKSSLVCNKGTSCRRCCLWRMINILKFADDTALLAYTREDIENLLTRLKTTSVKFKLAINRDKRKIMIVDRI